MCEKSFEIASAHNAETRGVWRFIDSRITHHVSFFGFEKHTAAAHIVRGLIAKSGRSDGLDLNY